MKILKFLLILLLVVASVFSGFILGVNRDAILRFVKSKEKNITPVAAVTQRLFFNVDSLEDVGNGIKQSLWAEKSDDTKEEIKYTLPNDFTKGRTQFFSNFVKDTPTSSPYSFLFLKDVNNPAVSQLMSYDKNTNLIKPVGVNTLISNSYSFSPDHSHVAVLNIAAGNVGDLSGNYGYYIDILDLKTLKVVLRHFVKAVYFSPDGQSNFSDNNNIWTSPVDFSFTFFTATSAPANFSYENGLPPAEQHQGIINLADINTTTKFSNTVYIWNETNNENIFYQVNKDTYLPVNDKFIKNLNLSALKVYSLLENKEQLAITNSNTPYIYVFDKEHNVSLKTIINKKDFILVKSESLSQSFNESAYGRRDLFISPDVKYAIALNETTGVILDMINLTELKTFDMPSGYMAYANKDGMLYNPEWTVVDKKTKWTSSNIFNMELYRIKKTPVTRTSKNMKINISDILNSK